MRTAPPSPRVEWRVLSIDNTNAAAYAQKLEATLQQLTDDGFNIINQMHRNDATILTAQRLVGLPVPPVVAGPAPPNPRQAVRTFRVDSPDAVRGTTTNEVLYHYKENGEQKQKCFPSLVDALRQVYADLLTGSIDGISVVAVSLTRFDPPDWPALFRRFADELHIDTRFDSKG